jgi:hypothetical protein
LLGGVLTFSSFGIASKSRISFLKNRKCRINPRLTDRIKTRLSLLGKTVAPAQRGRFWPSIGEQTVRKLGLSVSFEEKFYLAFP